MSPFKKLSGSSRGRGPAPPKISLRKTGSIGINQPALEDFFDEDDEYVILYFDEENNKLGLRGVEEESDDTYTLTRSESGGAVTPMSELKQNGLIPNITTQYSPEMENMGDTELVTIDLDNPLDTHGSPADEGEDEKQAETETSSE